MSTYAAKRTRMFKTEHIEGIKYSYFTGPSGLLSAGNRLLVDLKTFMPVMRGPKGNPWNESHVYLFDPHSQEIFSTADGNFRRMKGTTDPIIARSKPFAVQRGEYPDTHPTRVFNFKGYRFSRAQIAKHYEVYHDKCFESARGKPAAAITAQVADLFLEQPYGGVRNYSTLTKKVAHKNQGALLKGNQLIGKVVHINGSETIEFSDNPKIHSDPVAVKAELARLANLYPGEKFVSVVIDLTVVKVALDWS
jgi:hypothetical protein